MRSLVERAHLVGKNASLSLTEGFEPEAVATNTPLWYALAYIRSRPIVVANAVAGFLFQLVSHRR